MNDERTSAQGAPWDLHALSLRYLRARPTPGRGAQLHVNERTASPTRRHWGSDDMGAAKSATAPSGNILYDHFPNVVALAGQHCPGAVDGHPDHGFRCNQGRRRHHQLHRFHLDMQERWSRLREPGLDRLFEFASLPTGWPGFS